MKWNKKQYLKRLENKSTENIEKELEFHCNSLLKALKNKELNKMYQVNLYLEEIRLCAKVLIKRSKNEVQNRTKS